MGGVIGLQVKPFDDENYNLADDQPQGTETDEAPKNMIRWRFKRDANKNIMKDESGNPIRESNSRVVRWSDGSLQLFIGSDGAGAVYNTFSMFYNSVKGSNSGDHCH